MSSSLKPKQIYVPVRADGARILDSVGDIIAVCDNPPMAASIAYAINKHAGLK